MASPQSLHDPMIVPIDVVADEAISIGFEEVSLEYDVGLETAIQVIEPSDPYLGPYEVTPTQETQYLDTQFLTMTDNVKINPIPSNYGLITWNGSYLTVS